MRKSIVLAGMVVLLALVLTACNLPGRVNQPDGAQLAQTYAAQTIEARLTQNAGSGPTTDPGDPQTPSETPKPSDTPQPSETPKPTATATESVPCNQAGFIKDVTVPDGSDYAPGATFTKTWRLKNTGTCNWNNDYDLVFDTGDKMSGPDVVNLTIGTIEPGETVDISVDLKAPNSTGDYKGYWLLRSDDNQVFGLGKNDTPFYVEIDVVLAVSFEIQGASHYSCSGDKYVAVKVKNTGTETLESSDVELKNLDTNGVTLYIPYNTPFTENSNDCPPMTIDDLEPGDVYYVTFNMANSSAEYRFTISLCTGEGGGGSCYTRGVTYDLP